MHRTYYGKLSYQVFVGGCPHKCQRDGVGGCPEICCLHGHLPSLSNFYKECSKIDRKSRICLQNTKRGEQKSNYDTLVFLCSLEAQFKRALTDLSSEIGRGPVFSGRFGRSVRHMFCSLHELRPIFQSDFSTNLILPP